MLNQIILCRDVIAQEYLIEAILQVFPDEYHMRSLTSLLDCTSKLHSAVNIRQILVILIDRLIAYWVREKSICKETVDLASSQTSNVASSDTSSLSGAAKGFVPWCDWLMTCCELENESSGGVNLVGDEETDVNLFEMFWSKMESIQTACLTNGADLSSVLAALMKLSMSCYPTRIDYLGQIYEFACEKARCFYFAFS